MAEETKTVEKKVKPTNCAQTNKRIHRKDWYYRNGRYFANKQCYALFAAAQAAEKEKKAAELAKATAPTETAAS